MSLFKKSNRKSKNQRTRVDDSDEDNDKQSVDSDFNLLKIKNKSNNKFDSINDNSKSNDNFDDIYDTKPKAKSNPLLSFDVEEEESDVFKVKKSSYSRRMAKQTDNRKKKKDVKKEKNEENIIVDENRDKNKDDLNVIWIKSEEVKEIKAEPKEELKIFAGDQIESDEEYEEPEEFRNNEPFHHFRGALERGVIPDAKTIYELKKQRQMARDIEELIIPVNGDDKYDDMDSRVVREGDDDKSDDNSDDEDDKRISFAINRDNIEREKTREAFLMAQEENEENSEREDESEDELDRWEREQIKKGVRMPVVQMLSQEQATNRAISGLFTDNLTVVDMDIDRPFSRPKKSSSIPSKVLNKNKYSVTLEEVVQRVEQQLKILKESIAFNERQVVTLTAEFNESKSQINRLSQKRQELIDRADIKSEIKSEDNQ